MDELTAKYKRQNAEYDAMVNSAIASRDTTKIQKIKDLNSAMSKTLNAMIEKLTFLKKNSTDIKSERDKLIDHLRRIQRDYNGLLTNTDELETLRRIRSQESEVVDKELPWYLFAFFLTAFALLITLVFYGKSEATEIIASTVPITPALT